MGTQCQQGYTEYVQHHFMKWLDTEQVSRRMHCCKNRRVTQSTLRRGSNQDIAAPSRRSRRVVSWKIWHRRHIWRECQGDRGLRGTHTLHPDERERRAEKIISPRDRIVIII
ncbi:hypothetical protein VFPPC_17591 [Pochonia chlamydosporia 170]|uniref:Uncharacterized protein n=1 Tax=Pochonia chlamydosporia 170 TaxID=1380566 RepID=A0A219AR54_METCM|nr:hypothetical protein VFPPC_17591 [Pochonia chlamydosporia 170]OWT43246.1 hypothetical protein VFPPC_17591 [Pochonia chlamydosporia 170]